jgi:hypothetical protein
MPRSLLLPLIAAFALAACSKQADTGAAPAPETVEATDDMATPADTTAAVVDDTMAPADEVVPAEEPAMEEPAMEEPAMEEAAPTEEPQTEEAVDDSTMPADTTTWPSDSAAAQ